MTKSKLTAEDALQVKVWLGRVDAALSRWDEEDTRRLALDEIRALARGALSSTAFKAFCSNLGW